MILLAGTAHAKVGDNIGTVYNTDIVAYINHYAIPSYAVNGTSCIVAEDLKNFGFDVIWDNASRTLSISRNSETNVSQMTVSKVGAPASKFADLLETDIGVYGNNVKITSYAINGYTMIPIEELTMFGTCDWVESERALKLWVDNLHVNNVKQYVSPYVAPKLTYSSNTAMAKTYDTSSIVKTLQDCKRYVNLSAAAADVLSAAVDLYKINGKASLLVEMQTNISNIDSWVSKVHSLTASEKYLYPLYSESNITPVAATSYNVSKVSSYAQKVKRMKSAYDALCKTYGVQ